MVTPTATTEFVVPDPDDDPEVQRARATLQPLVAQESALNDRLQRLTNLLDPYAAVDHPVTADDRLDAIEHFAEVRVEAARATRARLQAEAVWRQARDAARDRVRVICSDLKATLVRRLAALLQEAAPVSRELERVEDAERNATGDWHRTGLAWPELQAASPTQGSRLEDWKRGAVAAGLLEPVD